VLEPKVFNLQELCISVKDMLLHTRASPNVAVSVNVPPTLNIRGDPVRWRQLLVKLLSHSLKVSKACLTLAVLTSSPSTHQFTTVGSVSLNAKKVIDGAAGGLYVEICDTGPGIAPGAVATLFEKNVQVGHHAGSGLGLSIAHMIAKLFGAAGIDVDSPWQQDGNAGTGTRFKFVIPAELCMHEAPCDRYQPQEEAALDEQGHGQREHTSLIVDEYAPIESLRILIVDDEPLNCMLMSTKMKQVCSPFCADLACVSVHSGEAAVEKFHEFVASEHPPAASYDLIVMDEHMGDLKGSEATRLLRQAGCEAVIVAASGNCLPSDQRLYRDAGADHCWPKPYPNTPTIARDIQGWFCRKGQPVVEQLHTAIL
jgi:CheY-like chemotaxis protein